MNKKIVIIACLMMMAIVLTGCSLSGEDKNKEETNVKQNQKNNEESSEKNNVSGNGNYFETMTNLMARGKSMKCTYTQKVEDTTANGVVYMADKNALVEITIKGENQTDTKMHALIIQDWHYSWVDGASKGYKMTAKAAEMDAELKKSVSDLSKEIDFKCKSWKKDNSKFEIPSNINFQDLSEMMEGFDVGKAMEEIENIDTDKMICDLCKNAPADEQAECLDGVVCDWQ